MGGSFISCSQVIWSQCPDLSKTQITAYRPDNNQVQTELLHCRQARQGRFALPQKLKPEPSDSKKKQVDLE